MSRNMWTVDSVCSGLAAALEVLAEEAPTTGETIARNRLRR